MLTSKGQRISWISTSCGRTARARRIMMPEQLVPPGSVCGNPACADYAQRQRGNLRRFGKTKAGVQRYQCKTCGQTFTATKGTPFYGLRTPQATILECLA